MQRIRRGSTRSGRTARRNAIGMQHRRRIAALPLCSLGLRPALATPHRRSGIYAQSRSEASVCSALTVSMSWDADARSRSKSTTGRMAARAPEQDASRQETRRAGDTGAAESSVERLLSWSR